MTCEKCGGSLTVLETYCTDPYQQSILWVRDVKQRCVCSECGLHQDVYVKTVKQDRLFK